MKYTTKLTNAQYFVLALLPQHIEYHYARRFRALVKAGLAKGVSDECIHGGYCLRGYRTTAGDAAVREMEGSK